MNTSITIKPSELNQNFLTFLKKIIATSKSSEVTITLKSHSVLDKETPKEIKERLLNSKSNLDKGENVVAFTWKEFDALSKKLIGKK